MIDSELKIVNSEYRSFKNKVSIQSLHTTKSVTVQQKKTNLIVRELRNELKNLGRGDKEESDDFEAAMPPPTQCTVEAIFGS